MYGAYNRCPLGYHKTDFLGKGGCAVVWMCVNNSTGVRVAVKQFPKTKQNTMNL